MSLMKVALAGGGFDDRIFGLDSQLLSDALIVVIAMFCLFLLLSYLLFNPARNLLTKRQERIREQMDTAAREKREGEQFKAEYDEKLKNVDKEAEAILADTRKKALKKENDIIGEAKEEAARVLDRASREVALEKSKMKDEVKQEMISVAAAMAGKIVATSLDGSKQSQLLAETLEEIGDETWLS